MREAPHKNERPRSRAWVSLVVSCLWWPLSSCSTPFGFDLKVAGGWDLPQPAQSGGEVALGDRIYMTAQRIEGIGSGLCALELPPDWKEHAMHPVQPGFVALNTPIEARWITRKEDLTEANRGRSAGWALPPQWDGDPALLVIEQPRSPLATRIFSSPTPFVYDVINERLDGGGDVYVLVPLDGFLKHGFSVYGALGPPVIWAHLGDIEVESGEGPLAFGLARTVGAAAYGLDVLAVGGSYLLGGVVLGPFGGFIIFRTPFMESLGSPPW